MAEHTYEAPCVVDFVMADGGECSVSDSSDSVIERTGLKTVVYLDSCVLSSASTVIVHLNSGVTSCVAFVPEVVTVDSCG